MLRILINLLQMTFFFFLGRDPPTESQKCFHVKGLRSEKSATSHLYILLVLSAERVMTYCVNL